MPVDGGDQLGVQVHVRAALLQRAHDPLAGLVGHLGQDPARASTRWKLQVRELSSG